MQSYINKEFLMMRAQQRAYLQDKMHAVFAHHNQVTLELGCGHGHFLTSLASLYADTLHIGIDKLCGRIMRAQRKAQLANLRNLYFIQGDILDFIEFVPLQIQWQAIYILFPDPWPKRRHQKHRWLTQNTLQKLAYQSNCETRLYMRTDVQTFFNDITKLFVKNDYWQLTKEICWPKASPTVFERYATEHYSLIAKLR